MPSAERGSRRASLHIEPDRACDGLGRRLGQVEVFTDTGNEIEQGGRLGSLLRLARRPERALHVPDGLLTALQPRQGAGLPEQRHIATVFDEVNQIEHLPHIGSGQRLVETEDHGFQPSLNGLRLDGRARVGLQGDHRRADAGLEVTHEALGNGEYRAHLAVAQRLCGLLRVDPNEVDGLAQPVGVVVH